MVASQMQQVHQIAVHWRVIIPCGLAEDFRRLKIAEFFPTTGLQEMDIIAWNSGGYRLPQQRK
jgi:hypothetical protein